MSDTTVPQPSRAPSTPPQMSESGGVARLQLTMALGDYDQLRDLSSGVVRADGIVFTPLVLPVEEIFYRFTRYQEWDVSEMSLAKYVSLTARGDSPMLAIPVFPSRVFRHSAIYVRTDRGIRSPADLAGKAVGIPEWAQTAGLYARGMLKETYGLDLASVRWIQAGVNEPGRVEKVALNLPDGVSYERRPETTLDRLLLDGDIDAAISARPPAAFLQRNPAVGRLFPDHVPEEASYFAQTGIFPIMHTIAVRRGVLEAHPWAAMNLMKAFEEAKRRSLERMADITASRVPMPWLPHAVETARETLGDDMFAYGIEPNRVTLDAFCRFAFEQGVAERRLEVDELFPAEVRSRFKV